ncbi:MAG TPA: GYDIA family GHMP kinase [Chitinophagales bacterium]|nr:GYDIA family GHMP kinase [Chitinophagales bacterium]
MSVFKANGKLLLTSEYFILDGAVGLCLPAKLGQTLKVTLSENICSSWQSFNADGSLWFACQFDVDLNCMESTDAAIAERLMQIFKAAQNLNPEIKPESQHFETHLQFPNNWGLGSSSTLISLVAQYFSCNPYELLAATFGGSGYDIACATANSPILFNRNNENQINIQTADFFPIFYENLYFIHLNRKQNSREGIAHYKQLPLSDRLAIIPALNEQSNRILHAKDLNHFISLLEKHESLIAENLDLPKVKTLHFSDFPGAVKSLGAWGGDFVLAASHLTQEELTAYFNTKGYFTIISYNSLIL